MSKTKMILTAIMKAIGFLIIAAIGGIIVTAIMTTKIGMFGLLILVFCGLIWMFYDDQKLNAKEQENIKRFDNIINSTEKENTDV